MSLLKDIQDMATMPNVDVATLLRKCKILAFRLGNDPFKSWVNNELNGYLKVEDLPQYRKMKVSCVGHFSGAFGRELRNAPIPEYVFPEEYREYVCTGYFSEPISSYESMVSGEKKENARQEIPSIIIGQYSDKIYSDMNCISAWKVIPFNAMVGLIDTIKTKVLDFSLELETVFPDEEEDIETKNPDNNEKVMKIFNTYIVGDVHNLTNESDKTTQTVTNTNGISDVVFMEALKALEKSSIDKEIIRKLSEKINDLKDANGTPLFLEKYNAFMASLSDHLQVAGAILGPYLPALLSMLPKG